MGKDERDWNRQYQRGRDIPGANLGRYPGHYPNVAPGFVGPMYVSGENPAFPRDSRYSPAGEWRDREYRREYERDFDRRHPPNS